ncbi:MAG: helix-turn-helix transcriptional regulator, partial [Clostridia bacterium]|nr:helix-turn-helix transcriptional regulator [Clostridia bacterium]
LGKLITEIRGERSLRKVAEPSGIPASQLQYIERGSMAPTAEVYPKLLDTLHPDKNQRVKMDQLYMIIRKTPPPDVCALLINNPNLIAVLRTMEGAQLSKNEMETLLKSIAQKKKGETDNG